jgi:hypothetical protein
VENFNTLSAYLGRLITLDVLIGFAFLAVVAYLMRNRVQKWTRLSKWKSLWVAWSIAGILAFTIRLWDSNGFDPVPWFLHLDSWANALDPGVNWFLNIALFMPSGFLLTAFGKRWTGSFIGLLVLSTTIELFQQYTKYGIGDPADFTANAIGAFIGVSIGRWKPLARLLNRD